MLDSKKNTQELQEELHRLRRRVAELEAADSNLPRRDLEKAYQQLQLIYNRVSDLIFLVLVHPEGCFQYLSVNRAFLEMTGLSEQNVLGKPVKSVLPEAESAFAVQKFREAIAKGSSISYEETLALPGGELTLDTTLSPILDARGMCTHLLGVGRNVTQQRKSAQEMIRLERLHALEEMAKGVAHNFNNILVGVLGYAQIVEMQSEESQTVSYAQQIIESAMRAKDLVQRLNLSVGSSADRPVQRVGPVNSIVQEAIKTTRPRWKDEAEAAGIKIEMREKLGRVPAASANPVDLHHILVHLIFNAVDATPGGGRIEISTFRDKDRVGLKVRDEGIGMDAETQKRIFEPFFTTKQDVGSGLGLSMAYRTVESWGGRIEVDSAPGEGAAFTVFLPIWEDEEEQAAEAAAEEEAEGRVLVIDDETVVRNVLKHALKQHTVHTVDTGEEAVAKFETAPYDVALIDLGIPGIPGDEVARRLRAIDPDLITIMITGWDLPKDDPRLEPFDHCVQKPFRLIDVQAMVNQAVARRAGLREKKKPTSTRPVQNPDQGGTG